MRNKSSRLIMTKYLLKAVSIASDAEKTGKRYNRPMPNTWQLAVDYLVSASQYAPRAYASRVESVLRKIMAIRDSAHYASKGL